MQEAIILLIFLTAAVYLGRMVYNQFKPTNAGCAKGCGSCSAINPEQLEKQIKAAQRA